MIYSLLEMTQIILSAMDSDEVNTIDDSVEATQVATLIRSVYYDLSTDLGLPEHEGLFQLTASGTTAQPVLMRVPSNVTELKWIRYDNALSTDNYNDPLPVTYMPFDNFLEMGYALREESSNVGEMNFTSNTNETFQLMYRTDRFPEYWSTMDEDTILFDAYKSSEESALQKSKTTCMGTIYPIFEITDTFTPDLDPTAFSLLLNKAKTRAFMEIKQMANQESAAEVRRQRIINQKRQQSVVPQTGLNKTYRFGRQGPFAADYIPKRLRDGS